MIKDLCDDVSIHGLMYRDTRICSLDFRVDGTIYTANISDNIVKLKHRNGRDVAEADLNTGKSYWYIEHCCNEPEFGFLKDDKCEACDTIDSRLEANRENLATIIVDGHYSKKLEEILLKHIPEYLRE
jgi:hypothetical protein